MEAPIVYLDSQDYSRFGDVLRGKADAATEALFLALEARKQAGDAVFAVSMPILGELLQYDVGYRETTMCKAEAVERLCGSWALAYPGRLITAEIVSAARESGFSTDGPPTSILSSDRFWYPDISDVFSGLHERIRAGIGSELATMGINSRALRRRAKKLAGKMDMATIARDAAPQMAEKYGLPANIFTGSIVALLQGQITPQQASHALFGAIAEPIRFVQIYFEKIENERTLPSWISGLGHTIENLLVTMRDKLKPYLELDSAREQIKSSLAEWPANLVQLPFHIVADDIAAYGIDPNKSALFAGNPDFVARVPSAQILGHVLPAYIRQILEQGFPIEHSFGGDLIHALYLPHVDLWRGDRRFSPVVRGAMPTYASRIVAKPKELPAAIDDWNAKNRSGGLT